MLHIVMGLPGTGKSVASKYLSEKLNAEIVNTDKLHSLLFPNAERTETGDFLPEHLAEIYRCLGPIAYYTSKIAPEKHIIFEGSFRFKSQRDFITSMLSKENLKFNTLLIELSNDEIAEKRITNRYENEDAPDTFEDYLKIKKVFEIPTSAYKINNSGSMEDFRLKLDEYIENLNN